jgi:DNA-binding Lrp family transcriptional regulator
MSKKKQKKAVPVPRNKAKVGDVKGYSSDGKTKLYWTSKNLGTKSSSSSSKAPAVNYKYDSKNETAAQYKARVAREEAASKTGTTGKFSYDPLLSTREFTSLPKDQQEVVKAIYGAIGENNTEGAKRLLSAFSASEKLADPYFKQQIRLASDALERGFVSIDKELDFSEKQAQRRLKDLKEDVALRGEYLTLEEQNALGGIERQYEETIKSTRQNLAASGFGSSSIRSETEALIDETTGDLRESTKRQFGAQKTANQNILSREQRDTRSEVNRLREVAKQNKTGLFRSGEEKLGSDTLSKLRLGMKPLGDVFGSINEARTNDVISGVKNLIF